MNELYVFFALLVCIGAVLASIAIWAPRKTVMRALAVLAAGLLIPIGYISVTELLSKPKPLAHEWFKRHVDEAIVLSVSFDEGNAIYLWLKVDETAEPRYYVMPWRTALAERLENLIDDALESDGTVTIKNPFSRRAFDNLGDFNVNINPPPSLPAKPPNPQPEIYDPRRKSIRGA